MKNSFLIKIEKVKFLQQVLKKQIENENKQIRMQIINEQLQESKFKRIQDYQEKIVEGQLMKLKMQKALEEDKKKEKEHKLYIQQKRREFIEANEKLEKLKEEKKFVVGYFGGHALSNCLMTFIEAAEQMQSDPVHQ